jgi:hypothetical protein
VLKHALAQRVREMRRVRRAVDGGEMPPLRETVAALRNS